MSANADAPKIGRPFTGSRRWAVRLIGRTWAYLKLTGPLLLALLVLRVVDWAGISSVVRYTAVRRIPSEVSLALSTNIVVLRHVAKDMSLFTFIVVALPRMLVGDVIWYFIGRRSAEFVKEELRPKKWFARKHHRPKWLVKSRHLIILLAVAVLTFFEAWLPPFSGVIFVVFNIYLLAGTARVKLMWVMASDVVASVAFLYVYYTHGDAFLATLWSALS